MSKASPSSSSIPFLRSFDAFAKPMDGLRSKTAVGGIITLLAMTFATLLFVSQLILYIQVDTRQSIRLTRSYPLSMIVPSSKAGSKRRRTTTTGDGILHITPHSLSSYSRPDHVSHLEKNSNHNEYSLQRNQLHVTYRITFPYVPCEDLQFSQDGVTSTWSTSTNNPAFRTRVPTMEEFLLAKYGRSSTTHHADSINRHVPPSTTTTEGTALLGCTVEGSFPTIRIGGDMTLSLTSSAWEKILSQIRHQLQVDSTLTWKNIGLLQNMTHYIHELNFGTPFHATSSSLSKHHHHHPFVHKLEKVDHPSGIAVVFHNIKIIPTSTRGNTNLVQLSTASHVIQPETLEASNAQTLPGIVFHYDISPLEVVHVESRENILVFLSSLISIVGGVYIIVGWMSQCLITSATAVAKKRD